MNEEINKIGAQHKNEIERMSESFSVKQRNSNADVKSQLQLKVFIFLRNILSIFINALMFLSSTEYSFS